MGVDVGFSVSHSRDWVIVAVSSSEPLGVDLECLDPLAEGDDLAEQVLTVAERRHYDGLPLADRRDWLYRAWTRKEAALKAAGHGLRIDPRQVEVGGPTTVVPGSCAAEAPMRLRLLDLSPVPGHLGALAWAGELEASVSYHQVGRLAPG